MKMAKILLVVVSGLAISCSAAGGLKPTIMTNPIGYTKTFPLNSITESEMILKAGPPNGNIKISGKEAMVYRLGEGWGERTYTYILDGGVIVDVIYNDSGPYNGSSAKDLQTK